MQFFIGTYSFHPYEMPRKEENRWQLQMADEQSLLMVLNKSRKHVQQSNSTVGASLMKSWKNATLYNFCQPIGYLMMMTPCSKQEAEETAKKNIAISRPTSTLY